VQTWRVVAARGFPATLDSVAGARRFSAEALAGSPDRLLDAVTLMVSELATNALVHAVTEFGVSVQRNGSQVRVEVSDGGGGVPEVLSPTSSEPHGRGLRIVEHLADAWGTRESPSGGKVIWFTVGPSGPRSEPPADDGS